MSTKITNDKTNQAWNKLYSRLDSDGLINHNNTVTKKNYFKSKKALYYTIITGSIAACIIFFFTISPKIENYITTLNDKESSLIKTLEDGSIIYLSESSSLQYPEHFKKDKRQVLLNGNAYFNVTGNKMRPFIIETSEAIIEVIGTSFNINNSKYAPFELSVWKGKVAVTIKNNNRKVYVSEGTTISLDKDKLLSRPNKSNYALKEYMSNFRFKDEKLENILNLISHNSPEITIQTTPNINDMRLTVEFSNYSPESMVQLICKALDLNYLKEDNVIHIKEKY